MPVLQPIYRSGQRQRSQAWNLVEAAMFAPPAPHVAAQTRVDLRLAPQELVTEWIALEAFRVGRVSVVAGQTYYYAASKFAHHYYVVVQDASTGAWVCSGDDAKFIKRVQAFVARIDAA